MTKTFIFDRRHKGRVHAVPRRPRQVQRRRHLRHQRRRRLAPQLENKDGQGKVRGGGGGWLQGRGGRRGRDGGALHQQQPFKDELVGREERGGNWIRKLELVTNSELAPM